MRTMNRPINRALWVAESRKVPVGESRVALFEGSSAVALLPDLVQLDDVAAKHLYSRRRRFATSIPPESTPYVSSEHELAR